MPSLIPSSTSSRARRWALRATAAALPLAAASSLPATASASHSQIPIIQDGSDLVNAPAAMAQFRALGATTVRVVIPWAKVAPDVTKTRKPKFNATDPNAYSASNWAPYDAVVRAAKADSMTIDFVVTGGAPRWAEASDVPRTYQIPHNAGAVFFAWKPNAGAYKQFVEAVGKRYSGTFTPRRASSALPRVHFWTIFNEPNFGEDLGPQATNRSSVSYAPMMYRGLLNAGWSALHATGHNKDTILIGDFAARGETLSHRTFPHAPQGLPGDSGQTRPLFFIRTLYCVDGRYRQLTGGAARSSGCPTSRGASNRFRRDNPALFGATGVGDHPYPINNTPNHDRGGTDDAAFSELGNLARTMDRVNRAYGSGKKYPIYNDEYGYITNPPNRGRQHYVSPSTAAFYINWAEYLSWRNGRLASYDQYLLADPVNSKNPLAGFASGLETSTGRKKPAYFSYRLPLYMPKASFGRRTAAEVWGESRPAHFIGMDTRAKQTVSVQLQARGRGAYRTVARVKSNGYFDIHQRFGSSGNVRLAYTYPTSNPFLPAGVAGSTVYSRTQKITVH